MFGFGRADTGTDAPTALQREILVRLASGMTDTAAARELCIGVRTLRRQVALASIHLKVHSRLALGIAVERAGWLGADPPGTDDSPAPPACDA